MGYSGARLAIGTAPLRRYVVLVHSAYRPFMTA